VGDEVRSRAWAPHPSSFCHRRLAPTLLGATSGSREASPGVAPGRRYIPELLDDVLAARINPGRIFDYETDLDHVADAYAAMDQRRAIKSLLRVSQP
jgi:Zn-dependent alcohol dehydrogenase